MLSIIMIGGVIALCIVCGRKRRRAVPSKARRTVANACLSARNQAPKLPQVDMERERLKVCRDYNRRIKAELEKKQAQEDIYHLEQRKRDLLEAYSKLPDANSERIIKKRIAYDNAIRQTEKQIEKAYMILHRTY